jgi:hypothetical protein
MLRSSMAKTRDSKDVQWAKLANVLAEAARAGHVDPQNARTALVHALRVRKNNAKLQIRPRSTGAQASIARAESGLMSSGGLAKRAERRWRMEGLQSITLQECRHTAATWLDAAGVSPKVA